MFLQFRGNKKIQQASIARRQLRSVARRFSYIIKRYSISATRILIQCGSISLRNVINLAPHPTIKISSINLFSVSGRPFPLFFIVSVNIYNRVYLLKLKIDFAVVIDSSYCRPFISLAGLQNATNPVIFSLLEYTLQLRKIFVRI